MPDTPDPPRQSKVQDRIALCQELLARGWHVSSIKAELRKRHGTLGKTVIGRYLAVARAREARDVARGRDLMRSDCLGTLDWLIRTSGESRDVLQAVRAKAELYGLNIKLPPVEAVCEAAGITVEQFYAALAQSTGRALPGAPPTPGDDPGPPAVQD